MSETDFIITFSVVIIAGVLATQFAERNSFQVVHESIKSPKTTDDESK